MQRFILFLIVCGAATYAYLWYVRGIDLLAQADANQPPPYAIAVRIPAEGSTSLGVPTWSRAASMPSERTAVGVAAVGTTIYVAGGIDGYAKTLATFESYETTTDEWTVLASLPEPTHRTALVSAGGLVYAIGGQEGLSSTPIRRVYAYDPEAHAWKKRAPLPFALGGVAAVLFEGKIHVFGGAGVGSVSDQHFAYDPVTDTWSRESDMVTGIERAAASVVDGKVYVVGGRKGSVLENDGALMVYDPVTTLWDEKTSMPVKRSGHVAVALDGKIYVFGGEAATVTIAGVDVYDVENDRWTIVPAMPSPRQGLGAAAVGGSIFTIAGGRKPGLSVSDLVEVFTP